MYLNKILCIGISLFNKSYLFVLKCHLKNQLIFFSYIINVTNRHSFYSITIFFFKENNIKVIFSMLNNNTVEKLGFYRLIITKKNVNDVTEKLFSLNSRYSPLFFYLNTYNPRYRHVAPI